MPIETTTTYMECLGCEREIFDIRTPACTNCHRCPSCGVKRAPEETVCRNCQHPEYPQTLARLKDSFGIPENELEDRLQRCSRRKRTRITRIAVITLAAAWMLATLLIVFDVPKLWLVVMVAFSSVILGSGLRLCAERGWLEGLLLTKP